MATAEIPIFRKKNFPRREEEAAFRQLVCKKTTFMNHDQFANWLIGQCVTLPMQPLFSWKIRTNCESLEPERWLCTDIAFSKDVADAANAFDHYLKELSAYRAPWKISLGFVLSKRKLLEVFRKYSDK